MKTIVALAVAVCLLPVAPAAAGNVGATQMRASPWIAQKGSAQKARASGPSIGKKHHKRRHYHRKYHKHRFLPVIVQDSEPSPVAPPPDLTVTGVYVSRSAPVGRRYHSSWVAACEALHPSFDARTGTYIGKDGKARRCR